MTQTMEKPAAEKTAIAEIVAADDRRIKAAISGDLATYESAFMPDVTYGHASGKLDTRDSIVQSLRSGTLRYRGLKRDHAATRIFGAGGVGVMTGQFTAEVTVGGNDRTMVGSFTAVWVRDGGSWKVAAWQATPPYKG